MVTFVILNFEFLILHCFQHPHNILVTERHRRGIIDGIGGNHTGKFLVVFGFHGRLQFDQAAGDDQVGDGLQELVGGMAVVGAVVRQLAESRHYRVFRQAGGLLVLQHRQHHQRDGLTVRDMVLGPDAVREGVHVARELRVDGVTAVHRGAAHRQPRFDILRLTHHNGQMMQDQLHAFQGTVGILHIDRHIAHRPFHHVAEGIHAAGGGHHLWCVDGQFAVEDHVRHIQTDNDGGTFRTASAGYHRAHSDFRTCTSGGGNSNHWQGLARHNQELDEQGSGAEMRQPRTRHYHLAGVHHRTAAQRDHTLGIVFHRDFAPFFNQRGRRFGVNAEEERVSHPGILERLQNFLFVAKLAQGLVGDHQNMLVAIFLANLADLRPCPVSLHHLRLRQRHTVNHPSR